MKLVIRQERERRGWTQKYVASKIEITQAMLQKIETGQRKPSYDVLVKLLDLFGYNDPRLLFAAVDEDTSQSQRQSITDGWEQKSEQHKRA